MIKNRSTTTKNIITGEITNDSRLFPLFSDTTKLLLQLFVLKIENNTNKNKKYELVYGWCMRTTREEISDEISYKDFDKIHKSASATYSMAKISIYNYPSIIVDLVNELLSGQSLKNAANGKLKTDILRFDFFYTKDFAIRPVIFDETNTFISRNPYSKNALISPYKDVPSFTLTVCHLDKTRIISDNDHAVTLSVLKHLQEETTLPFLTSGCVRFGNIEFINTQCCNEFEVGYVQSETVKEKVTIGYKEKSCCRKIVVSINPNIHTCSKNLLINCFLENGEQVILDECKKVYHEDGQILTTTFESKEQIGSVSISIWKEENGIFQIWYKYAVTLIRQIGFNMGIVGLHGTVQSAWLNDIKKSNSKTKEKVTEAEQVSKASYESMTIGGYDLDPWVKTDRNFAKYINQINPKKSDAEFFSQGWSIQTQQHGSISFLEWFKKQTQNAEKVVIQDPFYDTVGLEFLVRTTNANTEFIILTCTQTISTDDNEKTKTNHTKPNLLSCLLNILRNKKTVPNKEPKRAARIKSFISSNPSLCDYLNLSIYDMRSTGGGDTNLLHDRYILIFGENNTLLKGFHLSNSIQGATKKQPLLITPIPQDILPKIDNYINGLIDKTKEVNNIVEIVILHDNQQDNKIKHKTGDEKKKVINQELLNRLKKEIIPENVSKEVIINLLSEHLSKKTFPEFWATFGYFLTNANHDDKIASILNTVDNPAFAIELRKYLEASISAKYPFGFSEKRYRREYDFQFLFVEDFKSIVEQILRLSNGLSEAYGYGNYGVCCGCNVLLNNSFTEYIALVKFIQNQYDINKNRDLKDAPLSKLSATLFAQLLDFLLWGNNANNLIEKLLQSNILYMKAIAVSVLISDIWKENQKITFDESKKLLLTHLSADESLCIFITCLLNHRFRNKHIDSVLESDILSTISSLLIENYSNERLQNAFKQILYSYYPSIEKKFTEEILFKLEEAKLIDAQTIFQLWSEDFLLLIDNFESARNYFGIIELTGMSFQIVEEKSRNMFVEKLRKHFQKELKEIRKPFRQETTEWNRSFEKILLIKTVLMVAAVYTKEKYDGETQIINEIDTLEKNYQYYREHNEIFDFSRQVETEYKKIMGTDTDFGLEK